VLAVPDKPFDNLQRSARLALCPLPLEIRRELPVRSQGFLLAEIVFGPVTARFATFARRHRHVSIHRLRGFDRTTIGCCTELLGGEERSSPD
jgi:hypothetical protein